ncbi:MAG: YgiQ family radical SAM protein [Desulfamplus sp.]|nr:YgiQ family radical SAM protein [Desulfamplus sp.]
MFLPTTPKELAALGWTNLDVILITGDTYIDSPSTGVAVIGKVLVKHGFKVGIIAQPDIDSDKDIKRLGEPSLFWGITSGAVDSMVSNYTALKKRRKSDDYTPGGINNRRPDRAVIAYTNLVRRYFKNTSPIVLGGIEASLRRICHYDFWSDSIRRSILFDAKADYLIYGMGETAVVQLAQALQYARDLEYKDSSFKSITTSLKLNNLSSTSKNTLPIYKIRGLCYILPNLNTDSNGESDCPHLSNYIPLPSYEIVKQDKEKFTQSFHIFYQNNDPLTACGLIQKQDSRYLVQNPPAFYTNTQDIDQIAELDFERDVHPYYKRFGKVKALDTIQFSINTHRGCYGECNFCSIAVHEGRTVRWRSEESILKEVKALTQHPDFKGIISDAGGPTANMYGFECQKKLNHGVCQDKRCIFPTICKNLKPDHSKQISLLNKIQQIQGVKKIFVASGIRYDLMFADEKYGDKYLEVIVNNHVSGQLKIAPEHSQNDILQLMGKSDNLPIKKRSILEFKKRFEMLSEKCGKRQFLTYYFMAAHPGCKLKDMELLKKFTNEKLHTVPEQIQIFTPTPSTYSTLMYYSQICPFTGKKLFVEKDIAAKEEQKGLITKKQIYRFRKQKTVIKPK